MNNRIEIILGEEDMTRQDLSELTGIHLSELSLIIRDKKPGLQLATAKRISKALNKRVDDVWPD